MSRFAADLPADVVGPQRGMREGCRYGLGYFLHRYARNRLALVGLWVVLGIALVAIFAPWFAPASPIKPDFGNLLQPSTATHPMGTDDLGRDVLSRVMVGAQISLTVGIGTQLIVLAVGVPIGLAAGYFKGWLDSVVSFVVNVFYGVPDLLVALLLVVLLGHPGLDKIIIAISVTRWMDMTRLVRGQTLALREREFVEAARASGAKPLKILFGHILPNALGPVIVQATFGVPAAILFEAFLSFLGLGVPPPQPSWGSMAADGLSAIRIAPHMVIAPSIALSLTLMAFNFLGDGLRDALDPRSRR